MERYRIRVKNKGEHSTIFVKGFNEIWTDFLPWKTVKNLVEYYYMWKTTDRYVQQKRVKAVESEQKLKQVYVPDYSKIGKVAVSFNSVNILMRLYFVGDGALPAAACIGAVCVCCQTTSAAAWYEIPGAELAGMPQVSQEELTRTLV